MIEIFLARDEGKTLEFNKNYRSLDRNVRTAVAFANTAGGNIVIGVKEKTKDVVGRVFRELGLIEQWGSGLGRMRAACKTAGLAEPRFEELGATFRVTLFGERVQVPQRAEWQSALLVHLRKKGRITTQDATIFWKTSARTARRRLLAMVRDGLIVEVGRGPTDPYRAYVLKDARND